jgi:hypothetical protein
MEGTAVPHVRRWALTQFADLADPGEPFGGVRHQYSPATNFDQVLGNAGRVELVYWERSRSTVAPRAFKGSANIKYREEATADLIIVVAARNTDEQLDVVDRRAAEILGGVVLVFQRAQPPSPGPHLTAITATVASWEADPGILASATVPVHASTWRVEIEIKANVELT